MTSTRRMATLLGLATAAAVVLSGCAAADTGTTADDGTSSVVASTNVYGQIAQEIGGDLIEVTSIVTSGAQDPHSFEPSARDQLTVATADLIIENGGGYDAFIDALIESSGSEAHVLTAVEYSHDWRENTGHEADGDAGHDDETESAAEDHEHGDHEHVQGFNEHVWYDPHTIAHLAEDIAAELGELSPADAATFTANADAFAAEIDGLESSLAEIEAAHAGAQIFATEPVPFYLAEAAGLEDATPSAFSEAVEEGQDVAPATLLEALTLIESGDIAVMITNAQTGGAETTAVLDAAAAQDIPVVEFTETLPEDQTYISWMQANIEALSGALSE
ncbi:metal ABC transporter solute-binding protein, Zn/Mn family [Microbacterium hominis]|uniref:Zinc ABC transporter substrate-binding protein n=1 Tax=Microbacterium hominis TaxID=162426 RepID=A0A7D4TIU8_9MICO|nr:zinc ABC transporter substrate-binding protein [Microbacterium hominis]QKJ20921.1 zinc ABC transporter substrate-binding protein [Microbacterium hominis]